MTARCRAIGLLTGLGVLAATTTSARADLKGNLTIEVAGLQNHRGLLCLKVFSGTKGFPNSNDSAVKRQCFKITASPMTVTFTDLNMGGYAVAVFHDANGDRQLNRNSLGMPIEGYGFSRNPTTRTGPPQFSDAVFMLAGSSTSITIRMHYLNGR